MQMRIKGRNLRQLTLDKLGSIVQEKYINSRGEFQDKIYIYIYIYILTDIRKVADQKNTIRI